MIEGGCDFAQIHAASDEAPPFRKRTWLKANPSLRYLPDLEVAIRTEADEAKVDPSMMAAIRALRLNQGTDDVMQSTLLDVSTWRRITGEVAREGRPDTPALPLTMRLGSIREVGTLPSGFVALRIAAISSRRARAPATRAPNAFTRARSRASEV